MRYDDIRESRDYEDEYLPEDERWLRRYLHQGLDRWPSQWIIESLLNKRSNEEPMTIYRGMNFRTKESMDEFVHAFDGHWKQGSGISSWSPDRVTANEFAYVRKTYFPDEETFAQEKAARISGEKMRGVGGVLLTVTAPAHSLIVFSGGYESEVLLTPGSYACKMEIIKTFKETIADGFDINAYILSLTSERKAEEIEEYIRLNHVEQLSQAARDHLFNLDAGNLGQAEWEVHDTHMRGNKKTLYDTEVRFFYDGRVFEKAATGIYGDKSPLLKRAARQIFNEFKKAEQANPDAKFYLRGMGLVVKWAGAENEMKTILGRRIGAKYHELNSKNVGPSTKDDIYWVAKQLEELMEQFRLLTSG